MKTLLFVCTGNTCRSPMAEALARKALAGKPGWKLASAGLGAVNGQPASLNAVRAMKALGLDIAGHRSQMVTQRLVQEADFIFGLTQSHVEGLLYMYPEAAGKTFLLRQFDNSVSPADQDVSDPIGGSLEGYLACRDQIEEGVESVLEVLQRTSNPHRLTVAIGSDHAGLELKRSLLPELKRRGMEIHDVGTHSPESTDYPDYAHAVAHAVAQGQADFGILCCSTGIGMSMAANKVQGVRAALVFNEETAALTRRHNNANVLCLGAKTSTPQQAAQILEAFLNAPFEGGRHERRVSKMEDAVNPEHTLESVDPAIAEIVQQERRRQQENIELIASENFTSPAVMAAQGSVLTNKYAEGYPKKRWYGGCEFVDEAEQLAIDRAKQLFGAEHANVQPHSGSGANMAVYFSVLKPGDKLLTMDLSHGGHLTHGNKANFSGKFFEIVHYGVRKEDERIDYDQLAAMAREHKPKMITVGASAYPRVIDFQRMSQIAQEVGALLLADIAHIAGLVASGVHPSPVPYADFVTTTTHKTLRGPRGGLILCKAQYAKGIDSQVFPGIQGGPLMHVIAAKAVCFHEALQPSFKSYQQQIVLNAAALADGMKRNGFRLVSGGTENHLMLVDVGARGLTGKQCQLALDEAGITTNKNTIPFETRSPFEASGVRLGTPAVTSRGMKVAEMAAVADMISEVLLDIQNPATAHQVRQRVRELTAKFPLPY